MSDIRGYDVHYINKLEADIERLRASEAYMASKLEQTLVIEGELRQRIAELESALSICNQFVLEVSHAMQSGPNWYTHGESGLRNQVWSWVGKASKAIKQALKEG